MIVDGISHPVIKGYSPPYTPSYNRNWMWDPMVEYLRWYGFPGFIPYQQEMTISDYDITSKCWEQIELNDYLEQHGQGHLLLQRQQSSQWRLVFTNERDCYMFKNWWTGKTRKHCIYVKAEKNDKGETIDIEHQAHAWCKENLKGQWSINRNGTDRITAHVREDAEAVMFKLAFSGSDSWV